MTRLGEWLAPPRTGRPADTLRWVRRTHFVLMPLGLLSTAILLLEGSPIAWVVLGATALSVVGALTLEPAIRRAEQQPPLDPATAPERRRRANRVTSIVFGVIGMVATVVMYALEGLGGAIFMAAVLIASVLLALWALRRWPPA